MKLARHLIVLLIGVILPAGGYAADDARNKQVELGLLPIAATDLGVRFSVEERMRAYGVTGLSVAVVEDGRIAWVKGYGVADVRSGRRVTPQTLFQAASISKPIAALSALALVQRDRLQLDAPVNDMLTSWKVPDSEFTTQREVTVRTLLSHTSGLEHLGPASNQQWLPDDPVPTMVQILRGAAPARSGPVGSVTVPGATFAYSSAGYEVLQQLIVDVAGRPFDRYAEEEVLLPLGMTDSTFTQPLPESLRNRSAMAHYAGGTPVPRRSDSIPEMAVAGLWTTPTDLAKYIIRIQDALEGRNGDLLNQQMVQAMLTPGLANRGLGPVISGSGATARFGHDGFNEGFESSLIAYQHGGRGAVVMANSGFAFMLIKEVLESIARVYGWPDFGPTSQQPPSASMGQQLVMPVSPRDLNTSVGRYAMGDLEISVHSRDGRLFVNWPTNGTAEIHAASSDRYFCPALIFSDVGSPWLTFARDPAGRVIKIRAGDDGSAEFTRIGSR